MNCVNGLPAVEHSAPPKKDMMRTDEIQYVGEIKDKWPHRDFWDCTVTQETS